MSGGNVIDFVAYREERMRDRAVNRMLADEETVRDDVADFVANWLAEFERVAEEVRETIYDVDRVLGTVDQEPSDEG